MSSPATEIKLYDGITGLSPDYEHTYWFASDNARDTYFDAHTATGIVYQTVQHIRIDEGVVKLPYNIKDIHGFSYMSIQNMGEISGTRDHRYYCFILDMEYISDACTAIYFQVDVLQTYLHSMSTWEAFVERCHNDTDNFGDNIVAEPFTPSEYFVNDEWVDDQLDDMTLVIGISSGDDYIEYDVGGTTVQYNLAPHTYYKDVFTCIRYFKFPLLNIHQNANFRGLLKYFEDNQEKKKEVAEMYICPTKAIPHYDYSADAISTDESTIMSETPYIWYDGRSGDTNYQKVSGYTPKNKKLFCYPFNFMQVSNGEGDVKRYIFEFFSTPTNPPEFAIEGSFVSEPSLTLYPKNYKRKTTTMHKATGGTYNNYYNYDNALTLTNYPHCAFNVDVYSAYQSQNGASNTLRAIGATIVGGLVGAIAGGGLGLLMGAGSATSASVATGTALAPSWGAQTIGGAVPSMVTNSAIGSALANGARGSLIGQSSMGAVSSMVVSGTKANINNLANRIQAYNSADITLGNQSGMNVAIEHGHKNFIFSRVCCDPQFAEVVDNYFTMFGYAQNKIMNIQTYLNNGSRPYYKYIKCTNMNIHGEIENKYKTQLANIFNNGVTFWFNTTVPIGKYLNIDNSPVSQ